MPRMRILSRDEQDHFDRPPRLDHRERKWFFSPAKTLIDRARTLRGASNQIGFLTACGYFRATLGILPRKPRTR